MKEELTKKITNIKETITDKKEAALVLSDISEMIDMFMTKIAELTERQTKLEEKTEELIDMLTEIEEEMIENLNDEFEAECPYCGEIIPFKMPEGEEDFECPKCGNTIELELMLEEDHSCNGSCSSHHCDSCHECEENDDEEEKNS